MATNDQKLDLLWKKYLGVADAKPLQPYYQEGVGSSRQNIYANTQIFLQPIPVTAPTDLQKDNTFPSETLLGTTITNSVVFVPLIIVLNPGLVIVFVDGLK